MCCAYHGKSVTSSICFQQCYCFCHRLIPYGCPRRAERETCEEDISVCASAAALRGNCFSDSVSLVSKVACQHLQINTLPRWLSCNWCGVSNSSKPGLPALKISWHYKACVGSVLLGSCLHTEIARSSCIPTERDAVRGISG